MFMDDKFIEEKLKGISNSLEKEEENKKQNRSLSKASKKWRKLMFDALYQRAGEC